MLVKADAAPMVEFTSALAWPLGLAVGLTGLTVGFKSDWIVQTFFGPGMAWIGLYGAYLLARHLREQVCITCPYARFQG
jgi:polyferredoxin